MTTSKFFIHGALALVSTLCLTAGAQAESRISTTPGAACKLDGVATTRLLKAIESRMSGTSNRDAENAINIVCPIMRTQSTNTNLLLSVDGKIAAGRRLSCTVRSMNDDGGLLSSKNFEVNGASSGAGTQPFTQNLTMFASEMAESDYLSMQCLMPPNVGATIFGIRLLEQLP